MKRIEGERCLIFVPDGVGPHPILCFLHGAGEAAADKDGKPQPTAKMLANGSPAWHAEQGSAFISRFLVVCPQLECRRRWESNDAPWVDAVVQAAVRDQGGDLSRLVMTGFSYGGEGALLLGTASALAWKTIWVVDPALEINPARKRALPPPPREGVRVWVHHGDAHPGREHRAALLGALGLAHVPAGSRVVASLGTGDEKALDTNEWRVEHARTCQVAYGTPAMYEWVLR